MAITRERFKTYKNVFDEFTRRTLFNLSASGLFDELKSPVGVGKESNVFTADTKKDDKDVIIKIYRLETCDFKGMFGYLKEDMRYIGLKNQKRKVIFSWAQREYRNLLLAREAKINVPTAYGIKNNVLVLEMIGNDEPAPKLKDLKPKNPEKFLEDVIEQVKKLYDKGLVHGDLSHFNILNYKEKPHFIDFSQGTIKKSPNFLPLLRRDLKNVCNFFKKLNVKCDEKQIFLKIIKEK